MIQRLLIFTLLALCCFGCENNSNVEQTYQTFQGRDRGTSIYRAKIPHDWMRQDPALEISLEDSTKALVEFFIIDNDGKVRITIHNFPVSSNEERIPAGAQIMRWKRQFQNIDASETTTTPQSFSGYYGLVLEAYGIMNDREEGMLGWAMQLAPEHYATLTAAKNKALQLEESEEINQMRADFTIKATGPKPLIKLHKDAINNFARSFELINSIPQTS